MAFLKPARCGYKVSWFSLGLSSLSSASQASGRISLQPSKLALAFIASTTSINQHNGRHSTRLQHLQVSLL